MKKPIQGNYKEYSLAFRQHEVKAIYQLIEQGENVSIIGVGTVGKTHFIRHFTSDRILKQHYKGEDGKKTNVIFVHVDAQALLINSVSDEITELDQAWSGFEILLNRLDMALAIYGSDIKLQDLYGSIVKETANAHLFAFRHFETAIERIFYENSAPSRLIFIIDEFERFFEVMPASFFINLRAVRDQFRYKLLFMTLSRSELYLLGEDNPEARKKLQIAEGFFETFKTPVYLRQTMDNDLVELTRFLNARLRKGALLPDDHFDLLKQVVGGHGGLMRTALLLLDKVKPLLGDNLARTLLEDATVRRECQTLLESCIQEEQACLRYIANQRKTAPLAELDLNYYNAHLFAFRTLYEKGLIRYINPENTPARYFAEVIPQVLQQYLQDETWYQKNHRPFAPPANPRNDDDGRIPPRPTTLPK